MATLDFKELAGEPVGEQFEALVRLLGERLGLVVQWSGRGADGGRDLIFIENQKGPLNSRPIRWLVSRKDNSQSNKSVTEKDVGSISDKVQQHKCEGFLLATTTTASTGLKERMDRLDTSTGGVIQTRVWDRFEITKLLLNERCADLLLQFFPKQRAQETLQQIDAARQIVEASLPRFVVGEVRRHLVPYSERLSLLSGKNVWPHDADQVSIIDNLARDSVRIGSIHRAVEKIQFLHFDAFMAFFDQLIRNFPQRAMSLLKSVASEARDDAVVYNAIEILRESEDFSFEDELQCAKRCDSDTLFELYRDIAHQALEDVDTWDWRLPPDIQNYADRVKLKAARIDDLGFSGGDRINLSARLSLSVGWESSDPDNPSGTAEFHYDVAGRFEIDGIEIDSVT